MGCIIFLKTMGVFTVRADAVKQRFVNYTRYLMHDAEGIVFSGLYIYPQQPFFSLFRLDYCLAELNIISSLFLPDSVTFPGKTGVSVSKLLFKNKSRNELKFKS